MEKKFHLFIFHFVLSPIVESNLDEKWEELVFLFFPPFSPKIASK